MPPWERYQQQAQTPDGPWKRYIGPTPAPEGNAPTGEDVVQEGGKYYRITPKGEWIEQGKPSLAGQYAQSGVDAVASLIGAPVDIVNAGLSKIGLGSNEPIGGSASLRKGADYIATLPGRISDAASQGSLAPFSDSRTTRQIPTTPLERFASGTGSGAVDAATWLTGTGALSTALQAGSVPQRIAASMTTAPVTQVVSNAVGGGTSEATKNPLIGLAAAMTTAGLMGTGQEVGRRILRPSLDNLTPEQKLAKALLEQEGIPLRTGQVTGSRGVKGAEAVLERLPISGKMAESEIEQQQRAINKAILSRAGIGSEKATTGVLAQGQRTIGDQMDDIITRTGSVRLDPQFSADLQATIGQWRSKLTTNQRGPFNSYVKDLMDAAQTGFLDAKAYQVARSRLYKQAQSLAPSDWNASTALLDLRKALDGAMARSLSPDDAAKWTMLNRQYANLETITDAMKGQSAAAAKGDISPKQLGMSIARNIGGKNYARGKGDLTPLAKALEQFQMDVPNSGTPERLWWQSLLTGGTMAGGGINPALIASSIAGPPLAEKMLQSQAMRAYLTRPRAPSPTDVKGLLASVLSEQIAATRKPDSIKGP